jgi:NADPH-dependent curcumin reductase CurA
MTNVQSECWVLTGYPEGVPDDTTFRREHQPLPELRNDQALLETLYISVDPYMRGRMSPVRSYVAPLQPGDVIAGATVARVTESRHPDFAAGDLVLAPLGWRTAGVLPGGLLQKVALPADRASLALGALGMPGLTAYFGLLEVGQPKPGETVLVSGAAGAVGSVVGQIARLMGCRTVGVAGSAEKAHWLTEELGFHAALNYKAHDDLRAALAPLCPDGVDVYFDNVGGAVSDAALGLINLRARLVICGQIAQYNAKNPPRGPRPFATLLVRRARAEGFIIFDFKERFAEAQRRLSTWVEEGQLRVRETVVEGFENVPKAFLGLFTGQNIGKMVVKL